jgi:AcrR family transcriptional regulator
VLEQEGYSRATTNRIADVAGVNIALLYRYFAGKEAIVGALIDRAAATTLASLRAVVTEHATSPISVALRALLEAAVDTPGLPPALHRELVEHVDATRRANALAALRAAASASLDELLVQHARELRPLADRDAIVFVLAHALEAAAHAVAFYRPASLSRQRALDALHELAVRTLR